MKSRLNFSEISTNFRVRIDDRNGGGCYCVWLNFWNFLFWKSAHTSKYWFCTEPLKVSYEALKISNFFTKLIFKFRSKKIGFLAKGSSREYTGRTFNGSVELKIRFFGIWIHFEAFSGLRNLFCGFRKNLILFRVWSLVFNFKVTFSSVKIFFYRSTVFNLITRLDMIGNH